MVFDAEVIYHQDEGDWAGGVTEKTGGEGLVEVEALEEGDKVEIGQLTCFFEAVHRLLYAKTMYDFPALSCLMKGWRRRREKTAGEKRLVYILKYCGEERGDSR